MNNGNDEDRFVSGEYRFVSGEYVAYQAVWNNIYDRYFHICKKMDRLEKFYRLKDSRNEDNKNTKKD